MLLRRVTFPLLFFATYSLELFLETDLSSFFVDWGTDIYPIQVWETFIIALTYPLLLSPQQQTKCFSYIH